MPRDVSGVYSLPAGNPVVDGTIIATTWANPTMSDIAAQLNNVITRDGLLGPTIPFAAVDGTSALPGISFGSSASTGIFKTSTYMGFSYSGTEAMRINASGITGIKPFLAPSGTEAAPGFAFSADTDCGLYRVGTNAIAFATNGSEAWRVDANQRFSLGGAVQTTRLGGTSLTPSLQLNGASLGPTSIGLFNWSSTAAFAFARSKSGTVGSHTAGVVADGDILGYLTFGGDDGTNFTEGARVTAVVEGTPGTNDMPGALTFHTTDDGASTATEKMRLTSFGRLLAGTNTAIVTRAAATNMTPGLQRVGESDIGLSAAGLFSYHTSGSGAPYLFFARSKKATIGHTILADGDSIGRISFGGSDGTQFCEAARIQIDVDGTPGVNDMPGTMSFLTTPDGSATPTTKLAITCDGRVYGTALHNNAGAVTGTTSQYIASGTFTPTGTTSTNVSAVSPQVSQWLRVGNVVHVSGTVLLDVTTAANTASAFVLTLPIASTITLSYHLSGSGTMDAASGTARSPVAISGTAAPGRATFNFNAAANGTRGINYTYSYVVL